MQLEVELESNGKVRIVERSWRLPEENNSAWYVLTGFLYVLNMCLLVLKASLPHGDLLAWGFWGAVVEASWEHLGDLGAVLGASWRGPGEV